MNAGGLALVLAVVGFALVVIGIEFRAVERGLACHRLAGLRRTRRRRGSP